MPQITTD